MQNYNGYAASQLGGGGPMQPVYDSGVGQPAGHAPQYFSGMVQEDESPLYKTDEFRIAFMKVLPCSKRYVHDWTTCPFAHTGEKARRRDPRLYNYTGIACPDMKKTGNCIRGDKCPYAHNVFEYWLHECRYRTQLCNDGQSCTRRVCFFAHTLDEVRVPKQKPYVSPEALAAASLEALAAACTSEGAGLAPAGPGSLYKSYSCPSNHTGYSRGMIGPGNLGAAGVDLAAFNSQERLNLLNMMEQVREDQSFPPPNVSAPLSAPPMLNDSHSVDAYPSSSSPLPQEASNGVIGTAGDQGDIASSLAALKSALQRGKLPQDVVVKMLAELLVDKGDGSGAKHSAGTASGGPSGSASQDDLVLLGGYGSSPPDGDAELLAAAAKPGGLWGTASAPSGAYGMRAAAAANAAAADEARLSMQVSHAMAAQAAASAPPQSHNAASHATPLQGPGHDELAHAYANGGAPELNAAAMEMLHQSVASQSDAAACGQASQQAKLAKATTLNNWLTKLKTLGKGPGGAPPSEEQLRQLAQSMPAMAAAASSGGAPTTVGATELPSYSRA